MNRRSSAVNCDMCGASRNKLVTVKNHRAYIILVNGEFGRNCQFSESDATFDDLLSKCLSRVYAKCAHNKLVQGMVIPKIEFREVLPLDGYPAIESQPVAGTSQPGQISVLICLRAPAHEEESYNTKWPLSGRGVTLRAVLDAVFDQNVVFGIQPATRTCSISDCFREAASLIDPHPLTLTSNMQLHDTETVVCRFDLGSSVQEPRFDGQPPPRERET